MNPHEKIEFEYRVVDHDDRKAFSPGDLGVLASLAFWGPVSWVAPSRAWAPIARWLAARKHGLSPHAASALMGTLRSALELDDEAQIRALSEAVDGGKYELRAQILRLYRPGGWRPEIRLRGAEHLEEAAKAGSMDFGSARWPGAAWAYWMAGPVVLHDARGVKTRRGLPLWRRWPGCPSR